MVNYHLLKNKSLNENSFYDKTYFENYKKEVITLEWI